jgi:hypothetical protein
MEENKNIEENTVQSKTTEGLLGLFPNPGGNSLS